VAAVGKAALFAHFLSPVLFLPFLPFVLHNSFPHNALQRVIHIIHSLFHSEKTQYFQYFPLFLSKFPTTEKPSFPPA